MANKECFHILSNYVDSIIDIIITFNMRIIVPITYKTIGIKNILN